jgi:hypothetical protein
MKQLPVLEQLLRLLLVNVRQAGRIYSQEMLCFLGFFANTKIFILLSLSWEKKIDHINWHYKIKFKNNVQPHRYENTKEFINLEQPPARNLSATARRIPQGY